MEKKECKALLGSLSDYVDGTAEDKLCRELERHLAECEDCRIVVDTLRKTVYLYHTNTETNLPVAVRERLFKRLKLDEFLKTN